MILSEHPPPRRCSLFYFGGELRAHHWLHTLGESPNQRIIPCFLGSGAPMRHPTYPNRIKAPQNGTLSGFTFLFGMHGYNTFIPSGLCCRCALKYDNKCSRKLDNTRGRAKCLPFQILASQELMHNPATTNPEGVALFGPGCI